MSDNIDAGQEIGHGSSAGESTDATVRDVAEAAGVSVGTVSRYLNGHTLRPVTLENVEAAIRTTGYRGVPTSKVRTRKTLTIGTLFPRFDEFHVAVLSSLDKILYRNGYHLVTSEYEGNEEVLSDKLRLLKTRYADGIVFSPVRSDYAVLRDLRTAGIPIVTYNNEVPAWETDHVKVDDRDAVRQAVEYLIHLNHKRIAIISGSTESSTGSDRVAGYRDAIQAAGIEERSDFLMTDIWGTSELQAYDATRQLLESRDPPTAIFAAHYGVGYGVLRYIHDAELRIPEDVSLISFDDTELFQLHRPEITTIRQPVERIAGELVTLLFQRMRGDVSDRPVTRVVQTEFILRESVRKID